MFIKNKVLRFAVFIILVLLIIYLGSMVNFVFQPLLVLLQVVAIPLMLAVFFYYLIRPLVRYMAKYRINRIVAILLIYLLCGLALVWFSASQWPRLQEQLISFLNNIPNLFNALGEAINELEQSGFLSSLFPAGDSPLSSVTDYLNQGLALLTNSIGGVVSFVSNFTVVLFTFPILLFFMLKEEGKLGQRIVSAAPIRFKDDTSSIITEMDQVLSGFIVGRVLINLALGVLMYFGFILIDLPYAFLLTAVAVVANFVPFIGAILSAIPIVIVGLTQSPATAIWSLVIILVAQQVQDNLVAPYVFGKSLDIHPLTTIILVLAAGDIWGIIGMIIVIPLYMIVKIIAVRVFTLFFKDKWMQL